MTLVRAGVLEVAVERCGQLAGWPVVLLHGFPYDARAFDAVVEGLSRVGADVIVPYLRGYGGTRFRDPATIRSGQQAALAHDLLALLEALDLSGPIVAGYDWGGRAACLVSMLWPDRVSGLVTVSGYNVQDIAGAAKPISPALERKLWYQYYLHGERGRAGLDSFRSDYARELWREWSPTWRFSDEEFAATSKSFNNPDFVDVVVHSYRHRYGIVKGDPAYQESEDRIALRPRISVPTVVLDSLQDTVSRPRPKTKHEQHFTDLVQYRRLQGGHNLPQENPADFTDAIKTLHHHIG